MELVIKKHSRIDILDAIRGIAILSMVVYHGLYDIYYVFGYKIVLYDIFTVLEPPFAGAFILLCGVSCLFSHNNLKRGVRVFFLAMVVTFGTILFSKFISPGEEIYFGILHFMGAAIIIYAFIGRFLERIPRVVALPLWILLFAVTYTLPLTYMIGFPGFNILQLPFSLANLPWFFPFGLPGANFSSADYFPLVPWFFLFLAGTVLGVPIKEHKLPERFYTQRVPLFAGAGRNTLLIYVLHQPLLFIIFYSTILISFIIKLYLSIFYKIF
jgi:uncharacterized membrane protein